MDPKHRSKTVVEGDQRASHRGFLWSLGIVGDEMKRPFIGVINTWSEFHPGHIHLRDLAAFVKSAAIAPEMMFHEGPARVFESEEEMMEAILVKKIEHGDVIILRYEGPKGGPGMREFLIPPVTLSSMGYGRSVALVTDRRFSGWERPMDRASAMYLLRPW